MPNRAIQSLLHETLGEFRGALRRPCRLPHNCRRPEGGEVPISVDSVDCGRFSHFTDMSEYGQYYVKIFSKTDLEPDKHTLRIECDGTKREKTIDMISVM